MRGRRRHGGDDRIEDGQIRLWNELQRRGGGTQADARRGYRLSIRKPQPGFRLAALALPAPPQEKDKREAKIWTPFLRRGESIPIKVVALRQDGFDADIELRVEDLPAGVTAIVNLGTAVAVVVNSSTWNAIQAARRRRPSGTSNFSRSSGSRVMRWMSPT